MTEKRYAYRLKSNPKAGLVTSTYAARAPATSALHGHILYQLHMAGKLEGIKRRDHRKLAKEIAAKDYELVTFVLVEEGELESLQEDSEWLGYLEDAGVDNWQGYDEARRMQREENGEDEE